jgi:crcB protein
VNQVLAIAAGGAIGAVMRFGVSSAVYTWLGRGFPWGTLAVNLLGSLAMGFLSVFMLERLALGSEWRAFVLVGLLGAFTTFSTFSIETLNLMQEALYGRALLNVLASVTACVAAAFAGVILARQIG